MCRFANSFEHFRLIFVISLPFITITLNLNKMESQYPSLSDRFQSLLVDSIFIIILMFVFASVLENFENPPNWIRVALFFAIWSIYEPLCMTLGFTIGNYLKGIRVRQVNNINKRINPHCRYPENKSGFVGDSLFLISERGTTDFLREKGCGLYFNAA